jgi:hypothetical protein
LNLLQINNGIVKNTKIGVFEGDSCIVNFGNIKVLRTGGSYTTAPLFECNYCTGVINDLSLTQDYIVTEP